MIALSAAVLVLARIFGMQSQRMIKLQKVSIKQGDFSIEDVSLHVPQGCYAGLMGKSGCGKTSLLEAIAGLRPICSGTVTLNDQDVTHLKSASVIWATQDRALFPTCALEGGWPFH